MDASVATYYRIKFKNNPDFVDGIRVYTTPEAIRESEKAYEEFRYIEEVRPAKPKDPVRCEYCGIHTTVKEALLKRYYSNGGWVWGIFCSDACHSFRQMGSEG